MTDDSRTTKSAPKHPGTENAHEAWLAKTHAWSVGQGFDGALFGPDPRQYPLRAAAVTIDNDNDPRGPRDTVLPRQRQPEYDDSTNDHIEDLKNSWAALLPRLEGMALSAGMRATKEDGRDVIAKLDEQFGQKSNTQVAKMLIDFMKLQKDKTKHVADHASEWQDEQRRIHERGGFDKDTMETVMYLMSLGPDYYMFTNLACMYPKDQFTLRNVMTKARDFQLKDRHDEADTSTIALLATQKQQQQQQQTPVGGSSTGCGNCGNPFHIQAECFAKGGGLGHLNKQQRGRWLEKQRRTRDAGRFGANPDQEDNQYSTKRKQDAIESADIAIVRKLRQKVNKARKKLRREGITMDLGLSDSDSD